MEERGHTFIICLSAEVKPLQLHIWLPLNSGSLGKGLKSGLFLQQICKYSMSCSFYKNLLRFYDYLLLFKQSHLVL